MNEHNQYDYKHYQEVLRYYEWIADSKSLNQRWEKFKKSKNFSTKRSPSRNAPLFEFCKK